VVALGAGHDARTASLALQILRSGVWLDHDRVLAQGALFRRSGELARVRVRLTYRRALFVVPEFNWLTGPRRDRDEGPRDRGPFLVPDHDPDRAAVPLRPANADGPGTPRQPVADTWRLSALADAIEHYSSGADRRQLAEFNPPPALGRPRPDTPAVETAWSRRSPVLGPGGTDWQHARGRPRRVWADRPARAATWRGRGLAR